jgi:SAM-dependent methyltransferase
MTDPLPFDPRRFRYAAAHYLEGRPAYAERLIALVAQLTRLDGTSRVLDLGCGPGQLARAFASLAGEVLGVDPEPEMLRIARQEAAKTTGRIRFIEGSSFELDPTLGPFRLVVIGRAFHWMDRPATLALLDRMIEPDGAIALFEDDHPEVPENAWREETQALVERYTESDPVRRLHKARDFLRHEAVLLDSRFNRLERIGVIERRQLATRRIVGRALSMSSTSPAHLGPRVEDLSRELTELLARLAPDGTLNEVVESQALIARRG